MPERNLNHESRQANRCDGSSTETLGESCSHRTETAWKRGQHTVELPASPRFCRHSGFTTVPGSLTSYPIATINMKHLRMAAMLALFSLAPLAAAENGQITGRIIDRASQQPLPNASIQLHGTQLGALTGTDGSFVISDVPENVYKLKVSFIGYQSYIETDVRVIRRKSTYVEEIELAQASIELKSVVVTSGFAEDDDEAPVSNYNYAKEQIIRMPGSTGDILRAIEALPGVSTSGGEFSAFSVRGGTPRENIILVDNIPFSKVTHFDGGSTEEQEAQGGRFSIFAPGTVEDANFQGGGFSAQHGGKYSSLLDLTISEGNLQTPTIDGFVDLLGWEFNYSGPSYVHDKTSLFISARRQDFDRILELTNQEDVGSPAFTDIFVKTATQLSPRHKISLLSIFAREDFERTTEHLLASEDFNDNFDDFLGEGGEELALFGLNWRFLTGNSSYWQNTFFLGHRDSEGTLGQATPIFTDGQAPQSEDDFRLKDAFYNNEDQVEVGTRSIFTYLPNAESTLALGFELSRKDFDYTIAQNGLTPSMCLTAPIFASTRTKSISSATPNR